MKKITIIMVLLLVMGLCAGCGVPQAEYDALIVERDALKEQVETLKATTPEPTLAPTPTPTPEPTPSPTPTPEPTLSPEETAIELENYKKECKTIKYQEVARDPDLFFGENVTVSGTVLQVIEDGSEAQLRIAQGGNYKSVYFVFYERKDGESRILEDDKVVVYGVSSGLITYESVSGSDITVPAIDAKSVELANAKKKSSGSASRSSDEEPSDTPPPSRKGMLPAIAYEEWPYLID